jgi:hypothetical protein
MEANRPSNVVRRRLRRRGWVRFPCASATNSLGQSLLATSIAVFMKIDGWACRVIQRRLLMRSNRIWLPAMMFLAILGLVTISPARALAPCSSVCTCTKSCSTACGLPATTCGADGDPCIGHCFALSFAQSLASSPKTTRGDSDFLSTLISSVPASPAPAAAENR